MEYTLYFVVASFVFAALMMAGLAWQSVWHVLRQKKILAALQGHHHGT